MKKKTTIEFVNESKLRFGEKFNYSESNYLDAKTKLKIKCCFHGDFWQTPDNHLKKNSTGCPKCGKEKIVKSSKERDYSFRIYKSMTKEEFSKKVNKKYNNKFVLDLTNFEMLTKGLISVTCPYHGKFQVSPESLLGKTNKTGCSECGKELSKQKRTYTYEEIINICNQKFNYYYEYPDSNKENYINQSSSTLEIICKKHGNFKLNTIKHLHGRGCHKCRMEFLLENNIIVGGYSEDLFRCKPNLKNLPAFIYYLEINNGQYYKIGISKVSIPTRIKCIKSLAKKYNEKLNIKIIQFTTGSLYECFLLEQEILKEFKDLRLYRRWSTELFSKDILDRIIDSFSNLSKCPIHK